MEDENQNEADCNSSTVAAPARRNALWLWLGFLICLFDLLTESGALLSGATDSIFGPFLELCLGLYGLTGGLPLASVAALCFVVGLVGARPGHWRLAGTLLASTALIMTLCSLVVWLAIWSVQASLMPLRYLGWARWFPYVRGFVCSVLTIAAALAVLRHARSALWLLLSTIVISYASGLLIPESNNPEFLEWQESMLREVEANNEGLQERLDAETPDGEALPVEVVTTVSTVVIADPSPLIFGMLVFVLARRRWDRPELEPGEREASW